MNQQSKEFVILVDINDQEIGQEEKLAAHETGKLHRAFSIFLFNNKKELLLQQRALCKYHSAGLWTNTCCGHPRPGEKTIDAAKRRLFEEMGIMECELHFAGIFTYNANLAQSSLIEHEVDHVFYGFFDGNPLPNPKEIAHICWISKTNILQELYERPHAFSAWFAQTLAIAYRALNRVISSL